MTREVPLEARMQECINNAFVLLIQGSWTEAYHELGKHTEWSYTGEWRPPTATIAVREVPMQRWADHDVTCLVEASDD